MPGTEPPPGSLYTYSAGAGVSGAFKGVMDGISQSLDSFTKGLNQLFTGTTDTLTSVLKPLTAAGDVRRAVEALNTGGDQTGRMISDHAKRELGISSSRKKRDDEEQPRRSTRSGKKKARRLNRAE